MSTAPKVPKGAKSAYVFFCEQERPIVVSQDPKLSFTEIGKILGQRWKSADEATKKKYQDIAEADKQRFLSEVQNFRNAGGNEQDLKKKKRKSSKDEPTEDDSTKKGKPKSSRGKKSATDGPTIKRPMTAFLYYCKDHRKEFDGKKMSVGDVGKELGSRWKACDDATKAKYQEMANNDKQRFINEKNSASSLSASKQN